MAFTPISNTVPQYEENGVAAPGYFIKFYEAGTTTPTAMATDSTGTTLLDKCELNTEGYPINGSSAVFIPHINVEYKIALFRNAADADANDLNNAAWDIDGLFPFITEGSGEVANIADLRLLAPSFDGQQISLLGHTLAGIGGGVFYYDASDTTSADNNGTVIVTATGARIKRKLNGFVSPEMFGAVGDGVADDTLAIQDALDASLFVYFGDASQQYLVSGKLNLRDSHNLRGNFAQIRQTAVQTVLLDADGLSDATITGLELIGADEATYVNSPASQAIGVSGSEAVNLQIIGNVFRDFRYSPVMTNLPVDGATFAYNVVHGPGAAVLNDNNYRNTTGFTLIGKNINVFGNRVSGTASGGIIGQLSENVTVTGNVIHDIVTEHGLYFDTGIDGLTITGNVINEVRQSGIKVQNYDVGGGISRGVVISGNSIGNALLGDGILVINTGPTATPMRVQGLSVTGNTVKGVGQDGVSVRYAEDAVITGNSISTVGRAGLYLDAYVRAVATGNNVYSTGQQGVFDIIGSGLILSDNLIEAVGQSGIAASGRGIQVVGGSEKVFRGNTIRGLDSLMDYGIFVEGGDQASFSISDNIITGYTITGIRLKSPAEPIRYYANNVFNDDPLYLYEVIQRGNLGREFLGTGIPASGSYRQGDMVVNRYPDAGEYVGWVCVVSGSPGSWKGYGLIQS